MVTFPGGLNTGRFPVTGCPSVAHSAGRMSKHFMYRKIFLHISVVQEGREPLYRCNPCGIHMTVGRLINHQRTKRCDRNTHMRWQSRDVVIASRCRESSFSLTGDGKAECIEGVETFKYLVRILDRSEYNWMSVRQNFGKA